MSNATKYLKHLDILFDYHFATCIHNKQQPTTTVPIRMLGDIFRPQGLKIHALIRNAHFLFILLFHL